METEQSHDDKLIYCMTKNSKAPRNVSTNAFGKEFKSLQDYKHNRYPSIQTRASKCCLQATSTICFVCVIVSCITCVHQCACVCLHVHNCLLYLTISLCFQLEQHIFVSDTH
eukprot:85613_1